MIVLAWVLVAVSVSFMGVGLLNALTFKRIPRRASQAAGGDGTPPARVSVIVPARNEEAVLDACLTSLRAQQSDNLDILVVDDNSADATHAIATRHAAEDARVRVLAGAPLPEGWVGKTWACTQAAREAHGDWLLFVDADTTHDPALVASLVGWCEDRRIDLVSALPRQITGSFWERVAVPLMHYIYYTFIPMFMITHSRSVAYTAANGQVMLVRRQAYDAAGGHAAVRGSIVDDVWLARAVKSTGARIALANGADLARCRMYTRREEVWRGFTKNLFPGLGFHRGLAVGLMLFTLGVLLGWLPLGVAALIGGWRAELALPMVLLIALPMVIRLILSLQCRLAAWHALLQPLSLGYLVALLWGSMRAYARGGAEWKGRRYGRGDLTSG